MRAPRPAFLALAAALALATLVPAQTAKPAAKPAAAPPAPVRVTSVEGITEYTLGNGLHVLLFPDPTKATVTVNITYLVGSRNESYGETGMTNPTCSRTFTSWSGSPDTATTSA